MPGSPLFRRCGFTLALLMATVVALLPVAPLGAQQRIDVRRAAVREIPVRISGSYARLRVVAWAHDSIAFTGTIPKGARLDGGMGGTGPSQSAKYWIEALSPEASGAVLELRVPANARVWVKTATAVITVEGVTGELDLNIIAGSITVRGNPRQANLESMDGSITVDGSPGWMRIKTGDGQVQVRGSCEDLAISTVSGPVTVQDGAFERLRLESVTGAMRFAGDLARGASLSMDAHSGRIDFAISGRSNVAVDARSLTGRVENTLSTKRPSPGRDGRGEELALELGTGGAQAMLRSFKGSIRLSAR
jgi:hypothetical protein